MRSPIALVLVLLAAGCGGDAERVASTATAAPAATPAPACRPAAVQRPPYPGHGAGLDRIPWVEGSGEGRLVGLLWYWPPAWRDVTRMRAYTGGEMPQGWSMKVLWAFLDPSAKDAAAVELELRGTRLDGDGSFRDTFTGIGYEGQRAAPSYASIVDIPKPGCWRLTLTSGDLTATVDVRAVSRRTRR